MERLVITSLNVFRFCRLCVLVFCYDPAIEGFDQKPMHFNESGNHARKTLAGKGSLEVPLQLTQSQTHERWTLSTHVRSYLSLWPERPPLEAVFK